MTSTENAYTDIAWTTHLIGVFQRQMKHNACPVARARLVAELAAAKAALAAMKQTAA